MTFEIINKKNSIFPNYHIHASGGPTWAHERGPWNPQQSVFLLLHLLLHPSLKNMNFLISPSLKIIMNFLILEYLNNT